MGGGAWPFLVGGLICLINFDNERDLSVLNNWRFPRKGEVRKITFNRVNFLMDPGVKSARFLNELLDKNQRKFEAITG